MLLPHLGLLVVEAVTDCGAGVVVDARLRVDESACPRCGLLSRRVHSRYRRQLVDAPIAGRPVQLRLRVRRFFCDNAACAARTFAEQPAALTAPMARRTSLLRRMLSTIAVALAGRAGSRLAGRLGMPTSRDSLLRLLRGLPDVQVTPHASAPRPLTDAGPQSITQNCARAELPDRYLIVDSGGWVGTVVALVKITSWQGTDSAEQSTRAASPAAPPPGQLMPAVGEAVSPMVCGMGHYGCQVQPRGLRFALGTPPLRCSGGGTAVPNPWRHHRE